MKILCKSALALLSQQGNIRVQSGENQHTQSKYGPLNETVYMITECPQLTDINKTIQR